MTHGGAVGGFAREETRQRVDRGVVVDQRGRELPAEPFLELGREPNRLERADAEAGQGARMSTSSGRTPSGSATFAASQAVIALRDRDEPGRRAGAGARASRAGALAMSGRVHSATVSSDPARNASRHAWRWTFPLEVRGRPVILISRIAKTSMSSTSATSRRTAAKIASAVPSRSLRSTSRTIASRSSPAASIEKAAAPPARSAGWQDSAAHSTSCG